MQKTKLWFLDRYCEAPKMSVGCAWLVFITTFKCSRGNFLAKQDESVRICQNRIPPNTAANLSEPT